MSKLRQRKYLDESVKVLARENTSTDDQGSYKRLVGDYFKSVVDGIVKGLPSSFVKAGTKASSSADYYGGNVRGESDNFEWTVRVTCESRERGIMTGDIRVHARVGTKRMSFIIDGGTAPKEFVGDVVGWMTSKEVVRAT